MKKLTLEDLKNVQIIHNYCEHYLNNQCCKCNNSTPKLYYRNNGCLCVWSFCNQCAGHYRLTEFTTKELFTIKIL